MVAVLIVALATSTATYILWHQSLWLRQVENLTARAQADTLARAAARWAAVILAEDDAAVDHLGEAWARACRRSLRSARSSPARSPTSRRS